MKIEKLLKQKQELEEKIKHAEIAARNKNRVEKMLVRVASKHQILFSAPPDEVEKRVELALDKVAAEISKKED